MNGANKMTPVKLYRLVNPQSRAVGDFRYTINTGVRKRRQCIHCGQHGPMWSAQYPKTKRAAQWEADHSCAIMEDPSPYYAILASQRFPDHNPTLAMARLIGAPQ